MKTLRPFLANEIRLYRREPWTALLTVLLPVVLFVGLAAPASSRVADQALGGHRQIDTALPSLSLAISLTMAGLFAVPAFLATYRETGMLRRLALTPVSPSVVLVAQLVITVVTALVGAVAVLVVGWTFDGMALPTTWAGLVAAVLLGLTATFGLGLVIAAFAPTVKVATGIAFALMVPSFFLGGVYVPRYQLPHAVRTLGDCTPLGALREAVETAQGGDGRLALPLVILAAWSIGAAAVARWTFRWQ